MVQLLNPNAPVAIRLVNRLNGGPEDMPEHAAHLARFQNVVLLQQLVDQFVGFGLHELTEEVLTILLEEHEFEDDHRQSNYALHNLYVRTAIKHQAMVFRHLREVCDCANLTMMPLSEDMLKFMITSTLTNAAWCEAMLCTLAANEGRYPLGGDEE